ncbi:MAG: NADH-quinone oxidoreductase subunit C [Bacteroidota bacterium]
MDARAIFERALALAGATVFDFQEAAPRDAKDGPRDPCFRADGARVVEVMRALRDDAGLRFDFLQNLTAVDWLKRDVIEVVYHLFSYAHRHSACIKVELPRAAPRVPSVAAVWPTANWLEREQYDLLGVVFEGHPDLRRLLMPDDWVGHPMRKDFHEPKSYRGMPTSRPSSMDLLAAYDRAHVAKAEVATKPGGGAPAAAAARPPAPSEDAS